jgi:hypothetical protein
MTSNLWRWLPIVVLFAASPVYAQAWISGDCTVQNGEKIMFFISQGEARIAYGTGAPHAAFPKIEGNVVSIVHIGQTANFVLSVDVTNGRAYAIMRPDGRRDVEYNAMCKLNSGR